MSAFLCESPINIHPFRNGTEEAFAFMVPDFKIGDVATLCGDRAHLLAYVQTVQHIMNQGSPIIFIDGGNSFSPYAIAEIVRKHGFDPKEVLKMVYVSRAFTAHQLSSLVMEKLEPFAEEIEANFVLVSDIASLFFHRDLPDSEARGLFLSICMKLSRLATKKQFMVLITYRPKNTRRRLYFEAALFGRSDIIVEASARGMALRFALKRHPRIGSFYATVLPRPSLMDYVGV
ncbi:MAG: hypothetical protein QXT77_05570 [Candidatus Methanomethylicaceae archaeon]